MSRAVVAWTIALICVPPGSASDDKWEFLPEADLEVGAGRSSSGVLATGPGDDVSLWWGRFAGDLLWRRQLSATRYSDVSAGFGGSWVRQDADSGIDPTSRVFRLAYDRDLTLTPVRITVGGLFEDASVDLGAFEDGDARRLLAAAMFTEKAAAECELASTYLFYAHEDFDDRRNAGDPLFDRTDDGGYETFGLEQNWIFGEPTVRCARRGLFRRPIDYSTLNVYGGATYRRERTRGALVDADVVRAYFGGLAPVGSSRGLALEWRVAVSRTYWTEPRNDRAVEIEAGLRRFFEVDERYGRMRHASLLFAVERERRDSDLAEFDHDRWTVFVAFDVRFGGPDEEGGMTEGSSTIDRRESSGSTTPKVPGEGGG